MAKIGKAVVIPDELFNRWEIYGWQECEGVPAENDQVQGTPPEIQVNDRLRDRRGYPVLCDEGVKNLKQLDLLRTSTHEAGHAVVARFFCPKKFHHIIRPQVWHNDDSEADLIEMRAYHGDCQIYCNPKAPKYALRCIGLAGALAVWMRENPNFDTDDAHADITDMDISASDLGMMGQWTRSDLAKTIAILMDGWDSVIAIAQQMQDGMLQM